MSKLRFTPLLRSWEHAWRDDIVVLCLHPAARLCTNGLRESSWAATRFLSFEPEFPPDRCLGSGKSASLRYPFRFSNCCHYTNTTARVSNEYQGTRGSSTASSLHGCTSLGLILGFSRLLLAGTQFVASSTVGAWITLTNYRHYGSIFPLEL